MCAHLLVVCLALLCPLFCFVVQTHSSLPFVVACWFWFCRLLHVLVRNAVPCKTQPLCCFYFALCLSVLSMIELLSQLLLPSQQPQPSRCDGILLVLSFVVALLVCLSCKHVRCKTQPLYCFQFDNCLSAGSLKIFSLFIMLLLCGCRCFTASS